MTNPHVQAWQGPLNKTSLSLGGMNPDNFTETDADAVRALLAKHGLTGKLEVDTEDNYYVLVDKTWGTETFQLNLDDEMYAEIDDAVPSDFVIELVHYLADVAARGFGGDTIDWVMDMTRKNQSISAETQPTWADYEWLLKV